VRIPSLSFNQVQHLPAARIVDLRSPSEFQRDHPPGAWNTPLFDDHQRAIVGTLWKKSSPEAAYQQGQTFLEKDLGGILSEILGEERMPADWQCQFREISSGLSGGMTSFQVEEAEEAPTNALVFMCWRGGMRSQSMVALLCRMGVPNVYLMRGGYQKYRRFVMAELSQSQLPALLVLQGPTGVGKTRLLRQVERDEPGTVLDLEGLAQHRSSVLGAIGLSPVSQPFFETCLWERLQLMGPGPWWVEGESRKVGDAVIPERLWLAMQQGLFVGLEASLADRIAELGREYLANPGCQEELLAQLPFLEKRMGKKWVGQLEAWLLDGAWQKVAEALLVRYYDPRYAHVEITPEEEHSGRKIPVSTFQGEDRKVLQEFRRFRANVGQQRVE
jgi:tRNA 2-selenouridine synthase